MKKIIRYGSRFFLLFFLSLTALGAYAQETATTGREFYVIFRHNTTDPTCQIRYVVTQACQITAQYYDGTYLGTDNNKTYQPGVYTQTVDKSKAYSIGTGVQNMGLKVTSTQDIGVYGLNMASNTTDATCILPVTALGADYAIVSGTVVSASCIYVMATQAGTTFTIRNVAGTAVVTNQALNAVQGYAYVNGTVDLSGYTVEANHPVAVYSTMSCATSVSCGACDHVYEQMWPKNTAGKNYFVWNLSRTGCVDQIKIMGTENTTSVTIKIGSSVSTVNLNKGSVHTFTISGSPFTNNSVLPAKITADKPVIVRNMLGTAPALIWIAPVEQRVTSTVISPFVPAGTSVITTHYLHVMIPAGSQENMIVRETRSGTTTNATLTFYTNTADPNYIIATKSYTASDNVQIELINPAGLIAYMTAYGSAESYGYSAGAGAFNLQAYYTIRTKTEPYNDTHYSATAQPTHEFLPTDAITVKRTVEKAFSAITWLINGAPYTITENANINNTLNFPASALSPGENLITMSVRYNGASADSTYTGKVWLNNPVLPGSIGANQAICSGNSPAPLTQATSPTGGTGAFTYQWQNSTDNITFTDIIGATSATYSPLALTSTTYFRRAVYSAPFGPTYTNTVTVTVNPTPVMDNITNLTVCAGTSQSIGFTGANVNEATSTWTNSNPAIGLVASGTGALSFTAANSTTAPIVSTIVVTPQSANGCAGATKTFTVTVNPNVTVNPVVDKEYFRTQSVPAISFSSPTASGVTYVWANSNTAIGLAASGTGNIASFTATNTTAVLITGTVTVTPTYAGSCQGTPITFTIKVKPNPTITYHYNGGSAPATANPTNYVYGPSLTISNEPTRSGYTFGGWICPELSITTPVTPFIVPADTGLDLNLYADWGSAPNTYNITYDLAGGAIEPPNPNPATYDVTTPGYTLKNPVRSGYTFKGWSGSDLTGDSNTNVIVGTGLTGDHAYTAHWTPITYYITYNLAGGTAGSPANPATYTIESAAIALSSPSRTGYDFTGWTGANGTIAQPSVSIPTGSMGDRTYDANWTPVSYPITYTLNGGAATNPSEYYVTTPTFPLTAPTRSGYTFTGWTGSNGVSPQTSVSIDEGSTGAKNYTANWTRNTYTIAYTLATPNSNGDGTVSPPNPTTYHVDTTAITLINPTHPGYTFTGWSGTELTGNSNMNVVIPAGSTGNRAYTAHWALASSNDFTIGYTLATPNSNGDGTVSPPNPTSYNIETATIILNDPTHDGYTFTGWSGTDLTGDANTPVSILQGSTGNRTFEAHWSAPKSFTLSYILNGGSASNPATYTIETPTFDLTNPTREGYTFKGWSGTDLTGDANTSVSVLLGSTGNRTFEAHWEVLPSNAYTLSYTLDTSPLTYPDSVRVNPANPDHYFVNSLLITLTNPTHPGYTFTGWSGTDLTGAGNMGVTIATGSTGARAYVAHWSAALSFTIGYTLDAPSGGAGTVNPLTPNPLSYTINDAITLYNPTHPGYAFTGWSGTGLTGNSNTTVTIPAGSTGNRTYTAHWGAPTDYTITYELHGGSASNPTGYNITTPDFALTAPTRTGYTFAGWTGGTVAAPVTTPTLSVSILLGSTGNRTYEAHWTPITYTIGYTLNGGSASNPTSYTIESSPITLNTPTRTGYTFTGWSGTGITGTATSVMIPTGSIGNRNYEAHWTPTVYEITYTLNGGSATNPATYTIESPEITLNTPARTGYDFAGWGGTGLTGTGNMTVAIPAGSTGDRSYTASWTATGYTIAYTLTVPNGQEPPTPPANPISYTIESAAIMLINPAHPGYTFKGWSGTGLTGANNTTVVIPAGSVGHRVYTAHWQANGYTVTYNPNGGTNPTIPAAWKTYTQDSYPSNILVVPTRAGYTFDGWTGNGLSHYTAPFGINVLTPNVPGNLTYTAEWILNTYTIAYDPNGGTLIPGNPTSYDVTQFPIVISVPPTHPDPAHHTFIGWSSPELPTVPKQLAYNLPSGTLRDLTMKANWSEDLDALNGGTGDSLFVCQAPRLLYGDPQGQFWTWVLPDGSQRTSRNVSANQSGPYICRTDYGTLVVSDTLHTYFLSDVSTGIDYITTTGAKKGKPLQFKIRLPQVISANATAVWTVTGGGTIISVVGDTLTALWTTTGTKYVSVVLAMNHGGVNCTKTVNRTIKITERGVGFFVDQAVNGGEHNGSSWANAYLTIEEALSTATPGDRIWVAKGTYRPDIVKGSFEMKQDSVEIFGGFAGSEEYLYERDVRRNPTVMQGDDRHPVVYVENSAGVRVDGFTIENGHADKGAGIYFNSGSTGTVANNIIRKNASTSQGGGVFATAPWYGYNGLFLINTEISGNRSVTGAGIYNEGSDMRLLNVTVSGNKATGQAGGLYNVGNNPSILNTIIWGNLAATPGTENVLNAEGEPNYEYSIIGGSNGSGNGWQRILGVDGSHNKDANPIFLQSGIENDATLRDGNYHVSASGAAVDAGRNQFVMYGVYTPWNILLTEPLQSLTEGLPMDLDYHARIGDDDVVDIGAYEYNSEFLSYAQMEREVILPAIEGVVTEPGAGIHYVPSRGDFVFTIIPSARYADEKLVVATSRTRIPDSEGVTVVKNTNGSYVVTIHAIQDRTEIFISFGWEIDYDVSNVSVSDGSKVWSYKDELHVKTAEEGGELRVYTLSGQLFRQQSLAAGETVLTLPRGVYVVSLDDSGMKQKVIIK